MAEEDVEVLVLRDAGGNVYALPRRLVERARVPDDLKEAVSSLGAGRRRSWQRMRPLEPSARDERFVSSVAGRQLPWPIGWFRLPSA